MAGEPNTYSDADLDEIVADKDKRISELEAALRSLVADCDDYARINNLSGTWATIERARKTLG